MVYATSCYLSVFNRAILYEMWKFLVFSMIALVAGFVGGGNVAFAQEAAAPKVAAKASPFSSLLGEVTAIGPNGKQITLKPDSGTPSDVVLDGKTHFMKVAPGEKDLKKATDIQFSEIGVGDRVLARVRKLEDGSVSPATTVVVMTKAAIAQHQERGQAEWQTRGITGTVTVVNAATSEVTLKTQGADAKQIVVEPADKVSVRRYAPNSVKFSDSTASSVAEIKAGDTIRVMGTKNEDGTRVKPEEIVYGTFTRQAGTILAIDTAAGTVKMTDLATKKPVTVKVDSATSLKKLSPIMAQMMVVAQNGGRMPGGPAGPGGAQGSGATGGAMGAAAPNSAGQNSGGPGGMRQGRPDGADGMAGGMGGRRLDPSKMMERMPTITLAELKPGDAIMVSSSGMKDGMVSAISLVAGVEPLLTAPTKAGQAAGPNTSWNFEMSIPQ